MLIEPRQRLLLNLPIITVRLVRGIVAEMFWAAGPFVGSSDLPCGLALAGRWKEDALLAANYHACLWRRHGHQVGNVDAVPHARQQAKGADGAGHIVGLLVVAGRHPAHGHRGLDAVVERRQDIRSPAAAGQSSDADAVLVDFFPRQQVVHATVVVAEVDAAPGAKRFKRASTMYVIGFSKVR